VFPAGSTVVASLDIRQLIVPPLTGVAAPAALPSIASRMLGPTTPAAPATPAAPKNLRRLRPYRSCSKSASTRNPPDPSGPTDLLGQ
jgi:hypothetical protein